MVELLILLKRLECQVPVHECELPVQPAHEFHPAHRPEQVCRRLVHALVLGKEPDSKVPTAELHVARVRERIRLPHRTAERCRQRLSEQLHGFEKNNYLIRSPALDV